MTQNSESPCTIKELIEALQVISAQEGENMPVYVHQRRSLTRMRLSKRRVQKPDAAPRMVYRAGTRCLVLHGLS